MVSVEKPLDTYAMWLRRSLKDRNWRVVSAIFDEMDEDDWKECLLELAGLKDEGQDARRS
jgi:hypothetical protein